MLFYSIEWKCCWKSWIKKANHEADPPPLMSFRVDTSLFYLHRNTYPRSTWVRERMAEKKRARGRRGKIYWDWGSGKCSLNLFLNGISLYLTLFLTLSLSLHFFTSRKITSSLYLYYFYISFSLSAVSFSKLLSMCTFFLSISLSLISICVHPQSISVSNSLSHIVLHLLIIGIRLIIQHGIIFSRNHAFDDFSPHRKIVSWKWQPRFAFLQQIKRGAFFLCW